MSHASDGELHAYLDGALDALPEDRARSVREHVESCPACRARLAEETSIRLRAHELVDAALPEGVELPSLEELRRQAAASTPSDRLTEGTPETRPLRPPRGIVDTIPPRVVLAWAASLVVALGVGWLGRDVRGGWELRIPPPRDPVSESAPAAPYVEEAEEPEVEALPDEPVEGESGVGMAAGARTPTGVASGARGGGAARQSAPLDPEAGAAGRGAAVGAEVEFVGAVTGAVEREEAAGERGVEELAGVATTRREAGLVQGETVPSDPGSGGVPMGLPGLPILSVRTIPGEAQELRIVQALPSGQPVELRYLRVRTPDAPGSGREVMAPASRALAEADEATPQEAPAAARSRADAAPWSEIVVRLGQWEILLRGPVSEDSLRFLSRSLQGRR